MLRPKTCSICGKGGPEVSSELKVCLSCIRDKPEEALPKALEAHRRVRSTYGLPPAPPGALGGALCGLCSNHCRIAPGEKGYCGLRTNRGGALVGPTGPVEALLHAYFDPHVTNCCAAWFCPAATGRGYPEYAYSQSWERGYCNYAVFFYGCNFDCLFCQNPSHKNISEGSITPIGEFVDRVKRRSDCSCVCYFGGSPEPQLPFAVNASKKLLEETRGRVMRICFEWNGCGNPDLVKEAAELSYRSGGNVKFDLKCFNTDLSIALSGVPNSDAYRNFETIAQEFYDRAKVPVLTATTLLVPGYVDEAEVGQIARFIAGLSPEIPYSLLLFHPDFYMADMPFTSRRQLERCLKAARRELRNVHIGNIQLLGIHESSL